jgi:hypothetical protein
MAAAKQNKGSWGGFLFVAFIAACAYAPALAGVAVVGGIIWLIVASNAKFNIGNNPDLMQTGQRGHVDVVIATRSQVRSKSGNGPWQHTWTIALDAQPPQSAGYRVVAYRKLPERAVGPAKGQRFAAWFDKANPQKFHVDWTAVNASSGQAPVQQQRREEESASVKRAQAYTQAHAKPQSTMPGQDSASVRRVQASAEARANDQPRRATPPVSYLPIDSNEPPPLVQADGGWDFDFAARGIDGRARIEDFAENTEDGSTEMALTVMPRGGFASYRTVVTTYVPYDRKFQIAKGLSVRVKVDPRTPGRLMIVS